MVTLFNKTKLNLLPCRCPPLLLPWLFPSHPQQQGLLKWPCGAPGQPPPLCCADQPEEERIILYVHEISDDKMPG